MSNPAELYICLYAKEFAAQALLRLRPELRNQPCSVMAGEPPLQQVCSLNAKARNLGVICGMTQVELETFSSGVALSRSPMEEATAKSALLECAGTFSPRVEDRSSDNAFLCVIDIAGTEKLFGPPLTLAQILFDRIRSLGISASLAVSCNFHAAICLARGRSAKTPLAVIAPEKQSEALAPLPLSVLDLSEEHAGIFALWGIQTLGMLASLPEKELSSRMGQAGKCLRQLARGELAHLFVPVEPKFRLEEHVELDTPVDLLDSLLFVVRVMLEQLIVRAKGRMLALASVTVTLFLDDRTTHTRTVKPAIPTNDLQLWIKLLHLDLEGNPPQATILSLSITAEPGSTSKVQLGLFSPQLPEPTRLDVTLARIRAIVGEKNVGRAVLKDTHQPDSCRVETFMIPPRPSASIRISSSTIAMRQLRPAGSVSITLNNRRPVSFFFREKRYKVEHTYGPWRASGNWWNPTLWQHEQWDIVARCSEGGLICCCLLHDPEQSLWQMMALYD